MSIVAKEVFDNDDLRRYIFTFYNEYREPTQSCYTKIKFFFDDCIINIQFKLFTFIFYSARAPILSRL